MWRAWQSGLAEIRHLVLVGLPGAGKTAVGERLARRLGRAFFDFDAELERRAGRAVSEIFARDGEPAFRAAEAALAGELVGRPEPLVLAPGGGCLANPAAAATLRPAGRIIYLRVSPDSAVRRMGPDVARRPLVAGADPVAAVEALLRRREALYASADLVLDTDALTLDETVDTLEVLVQELERA
jgi:shikimate kinase